MTASIVKHLKWILMS